MRFIKNIVEGGKIVNNAVLSAFLIVTLLAVIFMYLLCIVEWLTISNEVVSYKLRITYAVVIYRCVIITLYVFYTSSIFRE